MKGIETVKFIIRFGFGGISYKSDEIRTIEEARAIQQYLPEELEFWIVKTTSKSCTITN